MPFVLQVMTFMLQLSMFNYLKTVQRIWITGTVEKPKYSHSTGDIETQNYRALYLEPNMFKKGKSTNYNDTDRKRFWINRVRLPKQIAQLRRMYPHETLNIMVLEGEYGNSVKAIIKYLKETNDTNVTIIMPQFDYRAVMLMEAADWYHEAVTFLGIRNCKIVNDLASLVVIEEYVMKNKQCHLFFMDLMCSAYHCEAIACIKNAIIATQGKPSNIMFVCSIRGFPGNRNKQIRHVERAKNEFQTHSSSVLFGDIYRFGPTCNMFYIPVYANYSDALLAKEEIHANTNGIMGMEAIIAKTFSNKFIVKQQLHDNKAYKEFNKEDLIKYCKTFNTFIDSKGKINHNMPEFILYRIGGEHSDIFDEDKIAKFKWAKLKETIAFLDNLPGSSNDDINHQCNALDDKLREVEARNEADRFRNMNVDKQIAENNRNDIPAKLTTDTTLRSGKKRKSNDDSEQDEKRTKHE